VRPNVSHLYLKHRDRQPQHRADKEAEDAAGLEVVLEGEAEESGADVGQAFETQGHQEEKQHEERELEARLPLDLAEK
jgi:hypothetical protein